jgi:biotin-(acetyl-CoA carboxylase) ligase
MLPIQKNCSTVEELGLTTPQLRWVNNLLVNNRKIGGILCNFDNIDAQNVARIGIGIK